MPFGRSGPSPLGIFGVHLLVLGALILRTGDVPSPRRHPRSRRGRRLLRRHVRARPPAPPERGHLERHALAFLRRDIAHRLAAVEGHPGIRREGRQMGPRTRDDVKALRRRAVVRCAGTGGIRIAACSLGFDVAGGADYATRTSNASVGLREVMGQSFGRTRQKALFGALRGDPGLAAMAQHGVERPGARTHDE
jgi:hypothetical protein